VRRQIAVFVREKKVCEWSKTSDGWRTLDPRRSLRDPCLVRPLPIRALFDGALAETAVARALEAKDNPAIVEMKKESEARGREEGEARGREEGEARGRAESLLTILEARGIRCPTTHGHGFSRIPIPRP
jgi:flagellar biosynthesis/type III secretory pathway protein FliH